MYQESNGETIFVCDRCKQPIDYTEGTTDEGEACKDYHASWHEVEVNFHGGTQVCQFHFCWACTEGFNMLNNIQLFLPT